MVQSGSVSFRFFFQGEMKTSEDQVKKIRCLGVVHKGRHATREGAVLQFGHI
jgi:hypothetical protein